MEATGPFVFPLCKHCSQQSDVGVAEPLGLASAACPCLALRGRKTRRKAANKATAARTKNDQPSHASSVNSVAATVCITWSRKAAMANAPDVAPAGSGTVPDPFACLHNRSHHAVPLSRCPAPLLAHFPCSLFSSSVCRTCALDCRATKMTCIFSSSLCLVRAAFHEPQNHRFAESGGWDIPSQSVLRQSDRPPLH